MGLISNAQDFYYKTLLKQRKISNQEFVVKMLPEDQRPTGYNYLLKIHEAAAKGEVSKTYQLEQEFKSLISHCYSLKPSLEKNLTPIMQPFNSRGIGPYGFKSIGATVWDDFDNPMQVYAYFANEYAAVRNCIDLVRQAVEEDGFFLVGRRGTQEKELFKIREQLIELGVEFLRTELMVHHQIYGNAFIKPSSTRRLGLTELKLLYPCDMYPAFDSTDDSILGWIHKKGRTITQYEKGRLMHLMLPAIDTDQIGSPPLQGAVTLMETALHAQNLNNTIFFKGGILGHLLSFAPNKDTNFNQQESKARVEQYQEQLDYLRAGIQGGHGLVAFEGLDKVFPITDPGSLDANWQYGTDRTDKVVAQLLGIPSEKIGIVRSSSLQYQPELVEIVINAQFDSTINRLSKRIDTFFNRVILQQKLGIYDMKIIASGRYGVATKNAAEAVKILSESGPIITVNEARERMLGWEPLPAADPRGRVVLNTASPRTLKETDTLIPDLIAPEQADPELSGGNVDKILTELEYLPRVCFNRSMSDGEFYQGS